MPFESSAGTVIYRKDQGKILYLLLLYPHYGKRGGGYWDFPKGHVEEGENNRAAAIREIEEETGLKDLAFATGFKQRIRYFFYANKKRVFKVVTFYLAQSHKAEVRISEEHADYKWFEYHEAMKIMRFKNAKNILRRANYFLLKK
ncbi:MAG TPA: NUDIX domain-containing protein [Candidatus Pacearchaeota archaeon]|nr:NUDIX domain-containing protein [Candidatus Pacearchaeota archaeon]